MAGEESPIPSPLGFKRGKGSEFTRVGWSKKAKSSLALSSSAPSRHGRLVSAAPAPAAAALSSHVAAGPAVLPAIALAPRPG
eukprot:CAMPEP_0172613766 /NCGR_PEP_ID=MMETSP1068-20121228/47001_1 /TAXON_ID=35684 /ORGANISM="Pseudopedinella elastica, Strain CCMP716" /LENGTH=81 /DNA_ID=CAMNT_0013418339 /DNA_START=96 /DNA_END=338 /DNA_ORIENTATION=-